MSKLIYNDLTLDYIHTHSIAQEPQYSDDLGRNQYLYTKIGIRVRAVVNTALVPGTQAGVDNTSAANTMADVRHRLLQPRKRLQFFVGNNLLVDSAADNPGPTFDLDARGGPIPRHCTVTRIAGTQNLFVDFAIDTYLVECAGVDKPDYISHRFRETVSIDENFFTSRTITGRLTVRADVQSDGPDGLRDLIAPKIPLGFKRVVSEWILEESGLSALYRFVDREVYLQPPAPAAKADGDYIESSAGPGTLRHAECRVRLEGGNKVDGIDDSGDKGVLLDRALALALSKVLGAEAAFAGAGAPHGGVLLKSAAVREALWDNKVEVVIKAAMPGATQRTRQLPMSLTRFGTALAGVDAQGTGLDPGLRGSARLLLRAAALIDPCLAAVAPAGDGQDANAAVGIGANVVPTVVTTPVLPDDADALYRPDDGQGGIYTDYQVRSIYSRSRGTLQLPLAGASAGVSSVFVQVAAAAKRLVVEWSAEKVGARPLLPDPNLNDANAVLLDWDVDLGHVEPASDGTAFRYRARGRYVYGFHQDNDALSAALPPFVSTAAGTETSFGAGDFVHGIIDA